MSNNEEYVMFGTLTGILPTKRKFEFKAVNGIICGDIDVSITDSGIASIIAELIGAKAYLRFRDAKKGSFVMVGISADGLKSITNADEWDDRPYDRPGFGE